MRLTLVRFAYLSDCTLGWLYAAELRLATIEDAWRPDPDGPGGQRRDGALAESCIPDGLYKLDPHSSPKYPRTWAMVNHGLGVYHWPGEIPIGQKFGRSACLIHAGNRAADVLGCIAIGEQHVAAAERAVTNSRAAMDRLLASLSKTDSYELQIRPVAGTLEKL